MAILERFLGAEKFKQALSKSSLIHRRFINTINEFLENIQ